MKIKIVLIIWIFLLNISIIKSQDTFSIVALDVATGEVGSAGASCVDMMYFPGMDDDFLGELFPGVGAINTQAYWHATNQANARNRMNLGDTPSEIIEWLINNDVTNQPQLRQYGIVALVDGSPESAAHTGTANYDYKNHITGYNYSIQGNILLGQIVLDSMEARFLRAEGDLACKLMAALQGAKMIGADTRCDINGTSSLFSFVKVAQPTDEFGNPSFLLSVRTSEGDGIEPIDSLQVIFDEVHSCETLGIGDQNKIENNFYIYPNPSEGFINISISKSGDYQLFIQDHLGHHLLNKKIKTNTKLDITHLKSGVYFITISDKKHSLVKKFIKY